MAASGPQGRAEAGAAVAPLERLRPALRAGPAACLRLADAWAAGGDAAAAWQARLMAAALRFDRAGVAREAGALEPAWRRQRPELVFLLLWTQWWLEGPAAAALAPDAAGLPRQGLHPFAQQALRYLDALRPLLAGAAPRRAQAGPLALPLEPAAALSTVSLAFNGLRGRFIVDTGAPGTLLQSDFARRCGLRQAAAGRPVLDGGGGTLLLRPGVADEVTAGGVSWPGVVVDVTELGAGLACDGIVSPQTLWRDEALLFDGVAGQLVVAAPPLPQAAGQAPLLWSEGSPCVGVQAGAQRLLMLLDTGAGASFLAAEVARELELIDAAAATAPPHLAVTAGRPAAVRPGPTLRVAVGTGPAEPLPLLLKAAPASLSPFYPPLWQGLLGNPWFRQRQVRLGADRQTLVFGAGAPA